MADSMVEVQDFASLQDEHMPAKAAPYEPYKFDTEDAWHDDGASSVHHSSGPDGEEEEEIFDLPSPQSSPRTSRSPSDISDDEYILSGKVMSESSQTPRKRRSPFRNPSSVRAMHTDITPPRLSSPSIHQRNPFSTPSRRSTPKSLHSHRGTPRTPSKMSPGKKAKKEFPLVLLHITLLPLTNQYSPEILESTLPPTILANWKRLQEKHAQTVLDRGLLIPHPREDYDLLEERLLESLELKLPRILKCGHFHLSPEEEADIEDHDSDHDSDAEDGDICHDCGRRVRDGRLGDAGTGSKRWDIKIYAANGLMRAGAWSAAWSEMERVDAEITPWMEDSMKRELELRREEDERSKFEHDRGPTEDGIGSLDDERLREIYGDHPPEFSEAAETHTHVKHETSHTWQTPTKDRLSDLSLGELLTKFVYMAARDRRNIAIFCLSMVVIFLSLQMSPRHGDALEHRGTSPEVSSSVLTAAALETGPVYASEDSVSTDPIAEPAENTGANLQMAGSNEQEPISVDFDQITQEMLSE